MKLCASEKVTMRGGGARALILLQAATAMYRLLLSLFDALIARGLNFGERLPAWRPAAARRLRDCRR